MYSWMAWKMMDNFVTINIKVVIYGKRLQGFIVKQSILEGIINYVGLVVTA